MHFLSIIKRACYFLSFAALLLPGISCYGTHSESGQNPESANVQISINFPQLSTFSALNIITESLLFSFYKVRFNKTYSTPQEEQHRFNTFRKNLAHIVNHNEKETSWTRGVNQFTDMAQNEFSQHLCGLVPKPINVQTNLFNPTNLDSLPASVNWVQRGAVTPVKNQQQCGSCWAFSSTGSMEGAWFIQNGELLSLSEQQLMDCSRPEGDQSCEGGLMDDAFTYAKLSSGICSESSYPYKAADESTCMACTPVVQIASYLDVQSDNETALLAAVALQPVSVAVDASGMDWQMYSGGVLTDVNCGTQLDHGVLVVGYGTDAATNTPYWLVKNSWGTTWGEQGYIRIARGSGGPAGLCGIASLPSFPVAKTKQRGKVYF